MAASISELKVMRLVTAARGYIGLDLDVNVSVCTHTIFLHRLSYEGCYKICVSEAILLAVS